MSTNGDVNGKDVLEKIILKIQEYIASIHLLLYMLFTLVVSLPKSIHFIAKVMVVIDNPKFTDYSQLLNYCHVYRTHLSECYIVYKEQA